MGLMFKYMIILKNKCSDDIEAMEFMKIICAEFV